MFAHHVNEHLTIRLLKVSEASQLFAMTDRSRHYLRQWLPWVDHVKTVDHSLQFIKQSFELYANRQSLNAGVFYQNKLAGIVSFNHFDWANYIGEIGYWLDIDQQGKGIMTQAVKSLIDQGFTYFDLNKIEIYTATENTKSQAIPQRLNFKKEGVIREAEFLYDHYVDHIVYGLLKKEWLDENLHT